MRAIRLPFGCILLCGGGAPQGVEVRIRVAMRTRVEGGRPDTVMELPAAAIMQVRRGKLSMVALIKLGDILKKLMEVKDDSE